MPTRPNSITMSKVRNTPILSGPGYDLLAVALDKIIPAHIAIEAARHRSRRHPSELLPKFRAQVRAIIVREIKKDRTTTGRLRPCHPALVDVFGMDRDIVDYILRCIMRERAQCHPSAGGAFECDYYPRWATSMDALVHAAVRMDRIHYGMPGTSAPTNTASA
jgi:hypothetical protein